MYSTSVVFALSWEGSAEADRNACPDVGAVATAVLRVLLGAVDVFAGIQSESFDVGERFSS